MKLKSTLLAMFLSVVAAMAQPAPAVSTFIKGDMVIKFDTRVQTDSNGKPRKDVTDKYSLNVNVSNSALFKGTIEQRPNLSGALGVSQTGLLTYSIDTDVVNPANPAQTRNVGRLFGTVPVDQKNVYRFSDGNLRVSVFGLGSAKGFESKFSGLALGKPPVQSDGFFKKLANDTLKVARQVNGKTTAIAVTKYDKMEFQSHVLAAGPVQIYPEATVSGVMIYDYGRTAWYFQNVTVTYTIDGRRLQDTLTGNIRWIEAPFRKTNGEGEYQFDIRVNEPAPSEASVFAATTDESAFFATDNQAPALVGTVKYKDTMARDIVTASMVSISLSGNQLSKHQVMYLAKLLFISSVGPFNAE